MLLHAREPSCKYILLVLGIGQRYDKRRHEVDIVLLAGVDAPTAQGNLPHAAWFQAQDARGRTAQESLRVGTWRPCVKRYAHIG